MRIKPRRRNVVVVPQSFFAFDHKNIEKGHPWLGRGKKAMTGKVVPIDMLCASCNLMTVAVAQR